MSEQLKVTGRIVKVIAKEEGTSKAGKEWVKQSFVIDTGKEYNPEVCFSVFGSDKVDMLSSFKEGQEVEVLFNVSSREFNEKYYHNLDAWAINDKSGKKKASNNNEENDDLPF